MEEIFIHTHTVCVCDKYNILFKPLLFQMLEFNLRSLTSTVFLQTGLQSKQKNVEVICLKSDLITQTLQKSLLICEILIYVVLYTDSEHVYHWARKHGSTYVIPSMELDISERVCSVTFALFYVWSRAKKKLLARSHTHGPGKWNHATHGKKRHLKVP